MEIIKLNKSHINAIHDLCIEQFKNEAWTAQQLISSLENKSTHFYGIFNGEQLVCFASIMQTPDDINLLDIATKDEYKRKGYAKEMLKFLIDIKNENQTFSLEVKETNLNAIKLYESFGFKTLHIRKKYYKDGTNALCMFLK